MMKTALEAAIRINLLEQALTSLVCVCASSENYDVNFEELEHNTLSDAIKVLVADPQYDVSLLEDAGYSNYL